jgi:hypothetical protein
MCAVSNHSQIPIPVSQRSLVGGDFLQDIFARRRTTLRTFRNLLFAASFFADVSIVAKGILNHGTRKNRPPSLQEQP